MRLLNCTTFQFTEFFDSNVPKYAILSHRWENEEVSYDDFINHRNTDGKGFVKIYQCCQVAASHGHEWVWIDTCCIDKKSSAELTEAINSMYRWYENAQICYAYLSDVYANTDIKPGESLSSEKDFKTTWSATFSKSAWFRRGWTLQELLAPKHVVFLDRDWNFIGTKLTLSQQIALRTGIDIEVFTATRNIKYYSVAQKMSWASKRVTSRVEDIAYCLLGIFDINMPLLYGEGKKAFLRLQEEIIRATDDESVFAWFDDDDQNNDDDNSGGSGGLQGAVLASSPSHFRYSRAVEVYTPQNTNKLSSTLRKPYFVTNRGLRMDVPLLQVPNQAIGTFLMPLSCTQNGGLGSLALLIYRPDLGDDRYIRVRCLDRGAAGFSFGGVGGAGGSSSSISNINSWGKWEFDGVEVRRIHLHLRPMG